MGFSNLMFVVLAFGVVIGLLFLAIKIVERKPEAGRTHEKAAPTNEPLPYEARGALLTDAELRFFAALEPAVARVWGKAARICVQVPVGSVVRVKAGLERGENQHWRNKVDRKTFDFVVTDARLRVLACIELDDSSHAQTRRRERDRFLERVCEGAGVRLVRITGKARYEVEGVMGVLEVECR